MGQRLFTPHQLTLLAQSCYGDPQLPDYLQRTLTEGPGPYDWPPAPGTSTGEQVPLWRRVFDQIWHQGTIYPATYVAVPVWCDLIVRTPDLNHTPLLELICLIEQSRGRHDPELAGTVGPEAVTAYGAALRRLVPLLPRQIAFHSETDRQGVEAVHTLLALQAFALGQVWTGMLLSRSPALGTGGPSAALLDAARMLGQGDLLRALYPEWTALPEPPDEVVWANPES